MNDNKGKVYLVGAGCGKADLITVRGLELLRRCDALVYDDLIAAELISAAPEAAERIYMGKRSGKHSASQEEICAKLIELAESGKTVVRLKGGDPFIFGRGGEEILALQKAGIPYDEVPGISSAIAIPAAAGIPVTHRKLSRSLHIITAHTADTADGLPDYFDTLAKLPGTLVFLMGLSKLTEIARRLMAQGMDSATPAAVLSGGNSANPATVRGTLADIAARAENEGVRSPAVIVVGAVAALDLSSTIHLPLSGKRIGITGTAAVSEKLKRSLSELGAECFTADASSVKVLPFEFDLRELSESGKKLIVFTSGNGVRLFFSRLRAQRFDLRQLRECSFAVIGRASGEVLSEYGFYADICPEVFTSEALADAIAENWSDGKIFIFRSADGSKILAEKLRGKFELRDIHTYTVETSDDAPAESAKADYISFSSAGGVRLYFERFGSLPQDCIPVCIGQVTLDALRKHYDGKVLLADECTTDGIISAVLADAGI